VPIRTLRTALWALCASIVLLAIGLAALAGLEPSDAWPVTVTVLLLAVLWLAHEWSRLWEAERRRGRRGG
jgi:apolipoprotein N-acyltransferase